MRSFHGAPYRGIGGGREFLSLLTSGGRTSTARINGEVFRHHCSDDAKNSSPSSSSFLSLSSSDVFKCQPTSPCFDDCGWQRVDADEDETVDHLLSSVPSEYEILSAISAIRRVSISWEEGDDLAQSSTSSDWEEPCLNLLESSRSHDWRSDGIYNALCSLQKDPCVQKLVISLSSDRAVWEAVMNNETVRELRDVNDSVEQSGVSEEGSVFLWMLDMTKMKVVELIEKSRKLVNELFLGLIGAKVGNGVSSPSNLFEYRVRSSLMISVLVLLIVVARRALRVCS